MTMRLLSKESSFEINNEAWDMAYDLGEMFGWKPAGTIEPRGWFEEDESWEPEQYFTSDGQTITKEDAAAWSAALKAALDDIPNEDTQDSDWFHAKEIQTPIEFFSGEDNKRVLRQFAGFLGRGGFRLF